MCNSARMKCRCDQIQNENFSDVANLLYGANSTFTHSQTLSEHATTLYLTMDCGAKHNNNVSRKTGNLSVRSARVTEGLGNSLVANGTLFIYSTLHITRRGRS